MFSQFSHDSGTELEHHHPPGSWDSLRPFTSSLHFPHSSAPPPHPNWSSFLTGRREEIEATLD